MIGKIFTGKSFRGCIVIALKIKSKKKKRK